MMSIVETFWVLDFDRTLGNTNQLAADFMAAVEEHSRLEAHSLAALLAQSKVPGVTFDLGAAVRGALTEQGFADNWQTIVAEFQARESERWLEPGARELLDALRSKQLPFGILTFGGLEWQQLKLEVVGFTREVPYLITNQPSKPQLFEGWRQEIGVFLLPDALSGQPALTARHLVVVDDKIENVTGLPPGAAGIHITPQTGGLARALEQVARRE